MHRSKNPLFPSLSQRAWGQNQKKPKTLEKRKTCSIECLPPKPLPTAHRKNPRILSTTVSLLCTPPLLDVPHLLDNLLGPRAGGGAVFVYEECLTTGDEAEIFSFSPLAVVVIVTTLTILPLPPPKLSRLPCCELFADACRTPAAQSVASPSLPLRISSALRDCSSTWSDRQSAAAAVSTVLNDSLRRCSASSSGITESSERLAAGVSASSSSVTTLAPPRLASLAATASSLSVAVLALAFCCRLARLAERLLKLLAMLTTLSLRMTDDADARTRCSLLDRAVIPGKGRMSRVHTSERSASSRARSPRDGASTGIRAVVVRSDWERLIWEPTPELLWGASFMTLVFLRMTWQRGDFGPTVVARCIDILLAMVPGAC